MIVVLVHILIFGYTKFYQDGVYCTPSTKTLSTALGILTGEETLLFLPLFSVGVNQGCHSQGEKVWEMTFFPGQGKVREF